MKSKNISQPPGTNLVLVVVPDRKTEKPTIDWPAALAPASVTALVAILGWVAVERFARSRERRSDIRQLVANFAEQVQAITHDAIRYYGLPGNSPEAASLGATLKAQIQLLKDHLDVLNEAGLPVDFIEDLKRFRQAVTGGDFESLARLAQPDNWQLAHKITSSGQSLVGAVRLKLFRELARNKSVWRACVSRMKRQS